MEYTNGNGAVTSDASSMIEEPIRTKRTRWRNTVPASTRLIRVTTTRGLMECWAYVKERLEIIKKKDKSCGHWLPEHIRHMVQEGIVNSAIRYPAELYLALDGDTNIHGFVVGYTKIDPYINLPLTYHIWITWGNRDGVVRFIPWLEELCRERGLTGVEFESGRFGWMGALRKLPDSGFYVKQTIYRKEVL